MNISRQEQGRVLSPGKRTFDTVPYLDVPGVVFEKESVELFPIVLGSLSLQIHPLQVIDDETSLGNRPDIILPQQGNQLNL